MSDQESFAVNAAKVFLETHPRYIACPENSKLLTAELVRLVNKGADPSAIATYDTAFRNCLDQLKLREAEAPKMPEELSMEEIAALSPAEQDKLPSPVLRQFANWESEQRRQKPQLSAGDAVLKDVFERSGFAYPSVKNARIIRDWMDAKGLAYSEQNIAQAIDANETALEPSQSEVARMSSAEYKERVVDPELREWQAKQPTPELRGIPFGVRRTRFLHER